jgi:hypothetical protein
MIFLFCLDTSASMNQRTTNGVRLIDAAKAGIEHFMLKRATDSSYATDRFFLVTFEDGPAAIKVCDLLHFLCIIIQVPQNILNITITNKRTNVQILIANRLDGQTIRLIFFVSSRLSKHLISVTLELH